MRGGGARKNISVKSALRLGFYIISNISDCTGRQLGCDCHRDRLSQFVTKAGERELAFRCFTTCKQAGDAENLIKITRVIVLFYHCVV